MNLDVNACLLLRLLTKIITQLAKTFLKSDFNNDIGNLNVPNVT